MVRTLTYHTQEDRRAARAEASRLFLLQHNLIGDGVELAAEPRPLCPRLLHYPGNLRDPGCGSIQSGTGSVPIPARLSAQ